MDGNDLHGITEKTAGVGKHTSVISLAKSKKHAYLSSIHWRYLTLYGDGPISMVMRDFEVACARNACPIHSSCSYHVISTWTWKQLWMHLLALSGTFRPKLKGWLCRIPLGPGISRTLRSRGHGIFCIQSFDKGYSRMGWAAICMRLGIRNT